ncbi:MAG: DUF393 domain-containing protein, partial [Elusimicrobia bacterium]|nr:DUF393 domain-containing protein [Elusimicrobiota bacterium]
IYDGDCAFCRRWVARFRAITGNRVDYEPFQYAARRFPEIPMRDFTRSIQFIALDGHIYSGAAAAYRTLSCAGGAWSRFFWAYNRIPGFAGLSERIYEVIARHRGQL